MFKDQMRAEKSEHFSSFVLIGQFLSPTSLLIG